MSIEDPKQLREIYREALERAVEDGVLDEGTQQTLREGYAQIAAELSQHESLVERARETRKMSAPKEVFLHRTEQLVTEAGRLEQRRKGEELATEAREALREAEDEEAESRRQRALLPNPTRQQVASVAARAHAATLAAEYHRARIALGQGMIQIYESNRISPDQQKKLRQLESEVQLRLQKLQQARAAMMDW